MKDTRKLAQGLASLGRNGDSVLVHMTPGEVRSLQTIAELHGGSLSIHPETGLHEAGFLKGLLPMLAGGIATVMTGGAAAPILAGAATGLLTKEKGANPWMAALTGGLGGWGGAGIGQALAGAGAAGAGAAGAADAGASAATQAVGTAAAPAMIAPSSAALPLGTGVEASLARGAPTFAGMGQGIKSLAASPSTIGPQMAAQGVGKYTLAAAASPGLYNASLPPEYDTPEKIQAYYEKYKYYPGANQSGVPNQLPFAGQRYEHLGRQTSYMGGGLVALSGGGMPPRMMDGPGDGMSDSIPARIDGGQEAALARDEFVVPADVVADIGNGSSQAGAQRLYAMMDRVRQMRHGTKSQPPAVDPAQAMPV